MSGFLLLSLFSVNKGLCAFLPQITPKSCVWRRGSARTRLGRYSASACL